MIDFFETDRRIIMVLPLMELALDEFMNEHADFMTESNVLAMFRSIVEAVDYMHRQSIMHCDIKPDNVMLGQYHDLIKYLTDQEEHP